MWILIAFSQEDPSRHTCKFPSSWDLRKTPRVHLCASWVLWWRFGAGHRVDVLGIPGWFEILGQKLPAFKVDCSCTLPWGRDHSIRGPTRPRLKTWDKGVFLRVFDAHCGCHPWDYKGGRFIHNLSASECVFSDGFTFFFFYLKDIFSYFSILVWHFTHMK